MMQYFNIRKLLRQMEENCMLKWPKKENKKFIELYLKKMNHNVPTNTCKTFYLIGIISCLHQTLFSHCLFHDSILSKNNMMYISLAIKLRYPYALFCLILYTVLRYLINCLIQMKSGKNNHLGLFLKILIQYSMLQIIVIARNCLHENSCSKYVILNDYTDSFL